MMDAEAARQRAMAIKTAALGASECDDALAKGQKTKAKKIGAITAHRKPLVMRFIIYGLYQIFVVFLPPIECLR